MSSRKKRAPDGFDGLLVTNPKPPMTWLRSAPTRLITYFRHVLDRVTRPVVRLRKESWHGPVIPPAKNSTFSPPLAPLAQNVSLVAPLRSKPSQIVPQLPGGCCQYTPAQLLTSAE